MGKSSSPLSYKLNFGREMNFSIVVFDSDKMKNEHVPK